MSTKELKEAGSTDPAFLSFLTQLHCQKESQWDLWECQSLTSSNKLETCTFMVRLNQAQSLKIKRLQFCQVELKQSSRKSSTPKMKDFLSPWLEKTSRLKWKVLMKVIPKEEISFATISITVNKPTNSRPLLTSLKFQRLKNWCHQDTNVFFTCTQLLNRSKSSRSKLNTTL